MNAPAIRKGWKTATIAAGILALASAANARPQATEKQQTETAAEAARKARDQKKSEPKPARVWDNDNISLPAADLEVIGPDANAPATDSGTATGDQTAPNGAAAQPALSPDELAHAQQAIKEAQEKIAELKADLDLAQRKYNLDAATYYGKPDFAADKDGQKAINQEKSGVDAKKQALQLTQQTLAELQAKVGTPAATKPPDAKPADTKAAETKAPESNPPNTQTQDAKSPDTKAPDAKAPETAVPDAKPPDTNPPAAKPPDTQAPETKPKQPNPPVHDS